jgi:hypothetical protein
LKKSYDKHGVLGILHKNRGQPSNRACNKQVREAAMKIIKTNYSDFGPTLVCEKLLELHEISLSAETIRTFMIKDKLWNPRPIKVNTNPHTWRARKDCFGQMQQYDGSYHNWFEGRLRDRLGNPLKETCLLAAIDDATGQITHAEFGDSEGVLPTMEFWQNYIIRNGKPLDVYLDRFSTYKNNAKKNQVALTLELTQFQRAMQQLGVGVIHANSPQGKGRIERLFQTLQDRLVKEMRLKSISTRAEANGFLLEEFLPTFNQKFAVIPRQAANLHRTVTPEETKQLSTICSIQDSRTVMNDYTISHNSTYYQINPKQQTLVRTNDLVIVSTKLDGSKLILKNDKELEFTEITERAKKLTLPKVMDRRMFGHAPKLNHPWKQAFIIPPETPSSR